MHLVYILTQLYSVATPYNTNCGNTTIQSNKNRKNSLLSTKMHQPWQPLLTMLGASTASKNYISVTLLNYCAMPLASAMPALSMSSSC